MVVDDRTDGTSWQELEEQHITHLGTQRRIPCRYHMLVCLEHKVSLELHQPHQVLEAAFQAAVQPSALDGLLVLLRADAPGAFEGTGSWNCAQ